MKKRNVNNFVVYYEKGIGKRGIEYYWQTGSKRVGVVFYMGGDVRLVIWVVV